MAQQTSEEIVSPMADTTSADKSSQLAERPQSLNGKSILLYSNNKQNADTFLKGVGDALASGFPDVDVQNEVFYKKRPGEPGRRWNLISELSEDFDVVLLAYGDCGACSRYTIIDALEFEQSGVPTVSYCSDKFEKLCQYDAMSEGFPGLPIAVFEHPIASLEQEKVTDMQVTDELVEDTIGALTNPTESVAADFKSRYSPEQFDGRPQFDECTIF